MGVEEERVEKAAVKGEIQSYKLGTSGGRQARIITLRWMMQELFVPVLPGC